MSESRLTSDTHYAALIIGAGTGGYPCAIRLGQLGVRTLIVEKENWGGVCLNVGCIPSKALITAAKRLDEIKHAKDMGIVVQGEPTIDMPALQAWKKKVVSKLTGGVSTLLKGNKVDTISGTAKLVGPHDVEITTKDGVKRYTADHIVVATGSRPIEVPGFSFSDPRILDSTGALALNAVPKRLAVIGGGYIGLELGGMYAKLGSQVVVVEMMDQLLPGFDADVVKIIERKLKKDGVVWHTKTKALGWENADDGVRLNIEGPSGKASVDADYILVTVGRRPNSEGLGLEEVGVKLDKRFVVVDKQLRTSVPHIFATGDVAGQPMLAHKATHEAEVVAEVIAGHNVAYDAKTVPAVVFTDPEIATAGMDESTAKARGPIKVGKVPYAAIGRAIANNETDGFYKVIIDAESKLVLGVTIVGYHASDLISEAALAIEMSAEALDVGLTIHPHPTLGEGVMEAAKHALGEAIHVMNN